MTEKEMDKIDEICSEMFKSDEEAIERLQILYTGSSTHIELIIY